METKMKTFAQSTFNPTTDHNARFAKKNLQLNVNTMDALLTYFENNGTITVCKPGKRNTANTSFPMVKGSVSNRGAKQVNLTSAGVRAKG
jgi:hypothetical protein